MTKRWLIFVESNSGETGILFVQAARAIGLTPVVFAADVARYSYIQIENVCAKRVDTSNFSALRAECARIQEKGEIAGILSTSDYFLCVASQLAVEFDLPTIRVEALACCHDKAQQRSRLDKAGVRIPKFGQVSTVSEALGVASEIGYPVVIKPIRGTGSVGVHLCSNQSTLVSEGGRLLGRKINERGLASECRMLVEEFIAGQEVSVEIFGVDVIGVTRKHLGPLPTFVEIGHDVSFEASTSLSKSIEECAVMSLEALGLGWGPSHVEIRCTPAGPVLIEVNARLAGDLIPRLYSLSMGIDLIKATVQLYSSQNVSLHTDQKATASCIRFITVDRQGTLAGIKGLDELKAIEGVYEAKMTAAIGSAIKIFGDFRDRVGHVITVADDIVNACSRAERALSTIAVEVAS